MSDPSLIPVQDHVQAPEPDGKAHDIDQPFSLGEPASGIYELLSAHNRQMAIEEGRQLASITIPSVAPPAAYHTGDDLPGTNQSINSGAVNNLASKLMFMAFPPGQPMLRLVPVEQAFQDMIAQDPTLYGKIQLALSRVELAHREEASNINLATIWVEYCKLLLITGNALWKHVTLGSPTFHRLDYWVTSRDLSGQPILTILKESVRTITLPKDVREILYAEDPELVKEEEWSREAVLYSICRLVRSDNGKPEDMHWEYWQETEKGTLIDGTELDTEFDDCPMWPGWMIPVFGQNYGRAYCEEYRGDLFLIEANSSALNDGAAQAALALTFVKPGSRTSLKQVQSARNLSFLSGDASDMTTFKADKGQDMQFVRANVDAAEKRIARAFLVQAGMMRQGERVTAEEVERVGQDLDQAMGGLYTQIAQAHQRNMIKRFVYLHNEAKPSMPNLSPSLVKIAPVTGTDAMGRSAEVQNLSDFAGDINKNFPPNATSTQILVATEYATRQAANRGIKPDALVQDPAALAQQKAQEQQDALKASVATQAAGPAAGAMSKAIADRLPNPQANQPSPPQPGALH